MRGRGVSAASRSSSVDRLEAAGAWCRRSTRPSRSGARRPSAVQRRAAPARSAAAARSGASCSRPSRLLAGDGDVGVQVEAVEVGLAGAGGGHPGRAWHAPELQHPRPGPRPEGAAALDRGTRDAGEREGRLGEGIGRVVVRRVQADPRRRSRRSTRRADGGDESGDLERRSAAGPGGSAACRRRLRVNTPSSTNAWQCTFSCKPEPNRWIDGHRAGVAVGPPGAPRPPAVPAEHGAHEHRDDGATERVVEGEAVAEPVRHGDGTNTNDTFRFEVQLTYRRRRMVRGQG